MVIGFLPPALSSQQCPRDGGTDFLDPVGTGGVSKLPPKEMAYSLIMDEMRKIRSCFFCFVAFFIRKCAISAAFKKLLKIRQ